MSVNVGMPKNVPWQEKSVYTGVFKDPVSGLRQVGRLNIEGDCQGDRAGHGGEQRAVFVYQIESYRYWERELGRSEWTQQATLAIRAHGPLEVLSDTIQPFPSFSIIYDAALMALRMDIANSPRPAKPRDARMATLAKATTE
jgi:hypothetical protein